MVDNPGVLLDDFAEPVPTAASCTSSSATRARCSTRCATRGVGVGLVLNPRDARRRGGAVPRRDRPAARDERATRAGAGRRSSPRCSTRSRRPQGDRRARAARSRSRSTAASTSTPRRAAAAAGVDILVAGSAVFGAADPAAAARAIRAAARPQSARRVSRAELRARGQGARRLRRRRRRHARRQRRARGRRAARRGRASTVVEHRVTADGIDEVAARCASSPTASPASSSRPAAPASAPATSRPRAPAW